MRIVVDLSICQDHGQCAIAAPAIFRMDESGKLVYEASPGDAFLADAEDAADVCPVQAISIID